MCEHEQQTCDCEQVNPNESFQEYPANINKILFNIWDGIFGDVEDHSTMCRG